MWYPKIIKLLILLDVKYFNERKNKTKGHYFHVNNLIYAPETSEGYDKSNL